jgi:hypothetical protein
LSSICNIPQSGKSAPARAAHPANPQAAYNIGQSGLNRLYYGMQAAFCKVKKQIDSMVKFLIAKYPEEWQIFVLFYTPDYSCMI